MNCFFFLSFTTVYALEISYPAFTNSSKAYLTHSRFVGQSAKLPGGGSSASCICKPLENRVLNGSSIWYTVTLSGPILIVLAMHDRQLSQSSPTIPAMRS